MSNRKYIVTKIIEAYPDNTIFNGFLLDKSSVIDWYNPDKAFGVKDLKIGDIVDIDDTENVVFKKKQYINAEPAIVTGANVVKDAQNPGAILNFITAFCVKYGDIAIRLDSPETNFGIPNPYIYTQRGDEILVRKTRNDTYEILTNKTVDKLRSDFLQKQK